MHGLSSTEDRGLLQRYTTQGALIMMTAATALYFLRFYPRMVIAIVGGHVLLLQANDGCQTRRDSACSLHRGL